MHGFPRKASQALLVCVKDQLLSTSNERTLGLGRCV